MCKMYLGMTLMLYVENGKTFSRGRDEVPILNHHDHEIQPQVVKHVYET